MTDFDCIVIGAGPAGLSASLTLGRARRKVGLFDDGSNRNRVTTMSHGFISRDGIKPQQLKDIVLAEIAQYPSTSYFHTKVTEVTKESGNETFIVKTADHEQYRAEKIVLATGIQEKFSIPNVRDYYGTSLFSCTYCDGWEMKDKPLIVIAEQEKFMLHMATLIYNWSKDIVLITNGADISKEAMQSLQKRHITIKTEPVKKLLGNNGHLQGVEFNTGEILKRSGGFIVPTFYRHNTFVEQLGCEVDENGTVITDGMSRTTQNNIYIAGETEKKAPSSVTIAAAEGNKAAIAVNSDLVSQRF
ncbi:NAD(P)/FAD-dependent oxidoreductase [Longirhabdus pacifica]|uniref:NAD(P)/FAD-dependent oxidoreductase n=1 Tax=Longirhabdus pacifica TaxID=2305227 RepID=UPI001008AC2B|nr:NAD(P)/FAD-dependent oxidoreductase [Longirhabdus pacifica]